MKIRKCLSYISALVLTVCLLAGCGSVPAESAKDPSGSEKATIPPLITKEESLAPKSSETAETSAPESVTDAPETAPAGTEPEVTTEAEPTAEETTSAETAPPETTPEATAPKDTEAESTAESGEEPAEGDLFTYEDEAFRFVFTGMEKEDTWLGDRYVLSYTFENLSDKKLRLYGENMNINGYMVQESIFEDASPGETLEEDLRFYASDLEGIGAAAPDKLSFRLRVRDAEDYLAEPVADEVVTCFPTGKAEADITPAPRPEAEGEEVILDEEDFRFVLLDEIEDSWYGREYRVYLENNTDRALYFTWDGVGVNGWNADPYWGLTVAAGARAIDVVSFGKSELARNGLTTLDEIRFTLRISDPEDVAAEDLLNETYTIYPTGLDPEKIAIPDRPTAEREKEILDTDELSVVILEEEAADDGKYLRVFLENKTETDLMFSFRELNINGVESESSWAMRVPAGLRTLARFSVEESFYEESGKAQIESLQFKLRVYDPDDYKAEDILEPTEYTYEP